MNNYDLVSKILKESDGEIARPMSPVNIKNDPAILDIKKRAEAIKAKADLMSAHNKIKKVKIDSDKIDVERQDHNIEMKKKAQEMQASANQSDSGV